MAIDPEFWVGGGFVVGVENSLQVSNVETENCLVIASEKAEKWPKIVNGSTGTPARLASQFNT